MDFEAIIQQMQEAITHLNDSYSQMAIDIAVLKIQMKEVLWISRAIIGASIVFVISRFWRIFTNWRNNKK